MNSQTIDVLQVSFAYWPDAIGGTEIYLRSLVQALAALGVRCAIAAPGATNSQYQHAGVTVFRIAAALSTDNLYGVENLEATKLWQTLLTQLRPKILHVHARTPMLHSNVLKFAQALGIVVIFTTHTPGVFCQRGTMLEFGRQPCDGFVQLARCTACALQGLGVLQPLAKTMATLPIQFTQAIASCLPASAQKAALFKARMQRGIVEQAKFLEQCDQVIAVCDWIFAALQKNAVPSARLRLNRQGLRTDMAITSENSAAQVQPSELPDAHAPLRVFALGRADPTKGFEVLVRAVKACAGKVRLDLALSGSDANPNWRQALDTLIAKSNNIHVHSDVVGAPLQQLFASCDLVAVPSTWMETGPLVVLEAFAQKRSVVGSDRGGIAELVTHQKNGWLVPAGDVAAWTKMLLALANDRNLVAQARAQIGPVRTMQTVALEHLEIYRDVAADKVFVSNLARQ
jgi:glycosyltransferase involved in cell wall biosynthesis